MPCWSLPNSLSISTPLYIDSSRNTTMHATAANAQYVVNMSQVGSKSNSFTLFYYYRVVCNKCMCTLHAGVSLLCAICFYCYAPTEYPAMTDVWLHHGLSVSLWIHEAIRNFKFQCWVTFGTNNLCRVTFGTNNLCILITATLRILMVWHGFYLLSRSVQHEKVSINFTV